MLSFQICALLPRLSSQLGHAFHYHLSVQKAAETIGWTYAAFYPQKAEVAPQVPSSWKPLLADEPSFFSNFFKNFTAFRHIFHRIKRSNSTIVFIEHFDFSHLLALSFAFFFLKPCFHFWILHRYELEKRTVKSFILRLVHWWIQKKVGKSHFRCLTDSELLAESLQKNLRHLVHVMPIPHTETGFHVKKQAIVSNLWWWPGGLIREEKGLSTIRILKCLLKGKTDAQLAMAECARHHFPDPEEICFVPTMLSRNEYLEWMQQARLILLPYTRQEYTYRTSGIFVEAISLGAIPVVTHGTWMAYELEKYSLSELVFHWNERDLIDRLNKLPKDLDMLGKLQKMQEAYLQFHSEKGFAETMKLLLKHS